MSICKVINFYYQTLNINWTMVGWSLIKALFFIHTVSLLKFSGNDKCRNALESNEQHDSEICSAREAVEQDVGKSSENMLHHFDSKYC